MSLIVFILMVILKVLFKRAQGSVGGGGNVVVKYEDVVGRMNEGLRW